MYKGVFESPNPLRIPEYQLYIKLNDKPMSITLKKEFACGFISKGQLTRPSSCELKIKATTDINIQSATFVSNEFAKTFSMNLKFFLLRNVLLTEDKEKTNLISFVKGP